MTVPPYTGLHRGQESGMFSSALAVTCLQEGARLTGHPSGHCGRFPGLVRGKVWVIGSFFPVLFFSFIQALWWEFLIKLLSLLPKQKVHTHSTTSYLGDLLTITAFMVLWLIIQVGQILCDRNISESLFLPNTYSCNWVILLAGNGLSLNQEHIQNRGVCESSKVLL